MEINYHNRQLRNIKKIVYISMMKKKNEKRMLYCETKKFLIKKIHTIFVFSCIRRKKYTLKKAHQYMRTQKKTSKNFKQVKVKSQQHSTNCCVAFFPFHSFVCLFVKNPRPHQHMRISPPRIQEFFYLGKKNSLGNLLQL